MEFWLAAGTAWFLVGLSLVLLFRRRKADLGKLPTVKPMLDDDLPSISLIIPVRDEMAVIDRCLKSYTQQAYPPEKFEIVVVDDQSTDGTRAHVAAIAASDLGLTLVNVDELPPGWRGKSQACWIGACETSGQWLCFVDADTEGEPELLISAIHYAEERASDLLSLLPEQQMIGFFERLLMPLPLMGLLMAVDTKAIRDSNSKAALAIGQFILVRREAYFKVDGHRAIREEILDDVALSKLIKANGFSIDIVGGHKLIRTRMYSDLTDIWLGLGRSAMDLFGAHFTGLAVFGSVLGSLLPLLLPILMITFALEVGIDPIAWLGAGLALLGSLCWLAAHALVYRFYHVPSLFLFLLPISYWGLAAAILDGKRRKALGRRMWKGRVV
jgi:chlorobactene glucosyltransferase